MWVARNSSGTLVLFERKPHRVTVKCYNGDGTEDEMSYWEGEITYDNGKGYEDGSLDLEYDITKMFPNLTWEDEPIEVELTLKIK